MHCPGLSNQSQHAVAEMRDEDFPIFNEQDIDTENQGEWVPVNAGQLEELGDDHAFTRTLWDTIAHQ